MDSYIGEYKRVVLDNGFEYFTLHTGEPAAFVKLHVQFGAAHEREDEDGLAHLLEHTLWTAGTMKYSPKELKSVKAMLGPRINATTTLTRTQYYGQLLSEDMSTFIDLISQFVFEPRFDPDQVESEKVAVAHEIEQRTSPLHVQQSAEYFKELTRDSIQTKNIGGDIHIVMQATPQRLREVHSREYHPSNMILYAAGELPAGIEELIRERFGHPDPNRPNPHELSAVQPYPPGVVKEFIATDLRGDHEQIRLDFWMPDQYSGQSAACGVLADVLGKGESSRLYCRLRDKLGLTYGAEVGYDGSAQWGNFCVRGSFPKGLRELVLSEVKGAFTEIAERGVSAGELAASKKDIELEMAFNTPPPQGKVGFMEFERFSGKSVKRRVEEFQAVTSRDIQDVVKGLVLPAYEEGTDGLMIRSPAQ